MKSDIEEHMIVVFVCNVLVCKTSLARNSPPVETFIKALLRPYRARRPAEVTCLQLCWKKPFRVAFHHKVQTASRSIWRERGKKTKRSKALVAAP